MTEERKQELCREWDISDQLDDEEYKNWYNDLTGEEQELIDTWDKRYLQGIKKICEDILERERAAHVNSSAVRLRDGRMPSMTLTK